MARERRGTSLLAYGRPNFTEAAQLLTLAAEQGDIEALMDLGWLFNDKKHFPYADTNVSKVLFLTAQHGKRGLRLSTRRMQGRGLNQRRLLQASPWARYWDSIGVTISGLRAGPSTMSVLVVSHPG